MNKKILIGTLIGVILFSFFGFWISGFFLFESPNELIIKKECDYEGLRKVVMYELNGNAVTNGAIHISASDCSENKIENSELIFTVSSSNIKISDVNFEWTSFDTLTIRYNKKLEIFKQKTESESVNPKIIFEYIAD
ncbi:hypothetical protein CJ739_2501 [Mariniflexile rhizosphaerae]|uniref:hypothetical protein n=1 Tax=unclassified Mariniflexile TaxID=2643887 RepID=UPI000E337BDC|nr:hypothetical protein [Mariniflexile sp. TRM1-10]AXP81574.1 hypothetical protein CJ739_2501 [Mariniflexile sp. TRM1-10]